MVRSWGASILMGEPPRPAPPQAWMSELCLSGRLRVTLSSRQICGWDLGRGRPSRRTEPEGQLQGSWGGLGRCAPSMPYTSPASWQPAGRYTPNWTLPLLTEAETKWN